MGSDCWVSLWSKPREVQLVFGDRTHESYSRLATRDKEMLRPEALTLILKVKLKKMRAHHDPAK